MYWKKTSGTWIGYQLPLKILSLTRHQTAEIKQCIENIKACLSSNRTVESMREYLEIVRQNIEFFKLSSEHCLTILLMVVETSVDKCSIYAVRFETIDEKKNLSYLVE